VIFATVGTQLPFDRLIGALDDWAGMAPGREVFAQIGPSRLRPRHIEYAEFVPPAECANRMRASSAIVAHAGMGTILTALELGRPLLVMPRRAALGEHRNDHQLATARRFVELGRVKVAFDESELAPLLAELEGLAALPRISRYAPDNLLAGLREFIAGPAPARAVSRRIGATR
jgi:UDP-N-acetylglucosamine transferase subunit ALG13